MFFVYGIMIFAIILIAVIIVLRIKKLVVDPMKDEIAASTTKDCIRYNDFVLTIIKRDPIIRRAVKIVNDEDISLGYEPEQTQRNAVADGGINKSKIYKTGGKNSDSSVSKNGKCRLEYSGQLISTIQLTNEQYRQALKSPVAKYLNDRKQIEVVDDSVDIDEPMMDPVTKTISNEYLKKRKQLGYPDRQKCEAILSWICGE